MPSTLYPPRLSSNNLSASPYSHREARLVSYRANLCSQSPCQHPLANYSVIEPKHQPDIFRDTLFRYTGYANELGVAFKELISKKTYYASYGVATLYAFADGITKAKESYDNCRKKHYDHNYPMISAGVTALDVTLFHILGTIIVPGKIIGMIHTFAKQKVAKNLVKTPLGKAIPIIASLSAIPLVAPPLDHFVNATLDKLLRIHLGRPTEVLGRKSTDVIGPLSLEPSDAFYTRTPLRKAELYSAFE